MTKLLWENLKLYKLSFLYSIITVTLGIYGFILSELSQFPFIYIFVIIIIGTPEFIRLSDILNSGYFRLLNKLPISSNDIYRHKFIISISGIVLIFTLILIINFFVIIPFKLCEFMNIMSSNLIAGIIIHNSTKLFYLPKKFLEQYTGLLSMLAYMIILSFYFSIFGYITSEENLLCGKELISINYLIYLIIQIVSAYYFGKLYNYILIRTKSYKAYQEK
jgi:hypothetical protein